MKELEQEIASLKKEIQKHKEEKERLDAMKSRLFSIVSHDLKSPLGILVGFADVLMRHVEDNYDTSDDDQLAQIKGYLTEGKDKILSILDNLVNWVKIENGSVPFRAQEQTAKKLIESVVTGFRKSIEKKKIKIDTSLDELTCFGDSTTIQGILKNILDNAIKYTPESGTIYIGCTSVDQFTMISIKNTGAGIEAERIPELFKANKDKIKPGTLGEQGIGLGLPVVEGFVALNKGKIEVSSDPANGTEFNVYIPSANPNSES